MVIANVCAQNYIGTSVGVYGTTYNAATTIGNGGSVLVGNGGLWGFGGNISSADKGNDNAPNTTGRSEIITFKGSGTYSNAATISGVSGNIIDGYAGAIGQATDFILPVGAGSIAYPVTVPSNTSSAAAYFSGSGSLQNMPVNNISTKEYSPYFDMLNMPAGTYTFSYPAGFDNTPYSIVLESSNTSASGTSGSTQYNLLANVSNFSTNASDISVAIAGSYGSTQVYFGTSTGSVLPVTFLSLTATVQKDGVQLNWATATEINNTGFEVQRSNNGSDWVKIDFVVSKANQGNSSVILNYQFTDEQPSPGYIYYRLKQIDFDDKTQLSTTVRVYATGNVSIKVFPIPANDFVNISGLMGTEQIMVVNTAGQVVRTQQAAASTVQISLQGLAAGIYYLSINGKEKQISRFKIFKGN